MSYISRSSRFRKKKKVNLKKVGTLLTLVIFVLMIFACVRYFSLYNTLHGSDNPIIWRSDSNDRLQLLLIGKMDSVISCSLLSIPSDDDQEVYVLRFPPQALLDGPQHETKTLAEIFSQGGVKEGIESLNLFLNNQLPVHHYVIYDVEGIREIVNAIEGVEIDLPAGFQVHHGDTDYVFAPGENTISANNIVPFIASDAAVDATSFWAEKSLLVEVFNQMFTLNHLSYFVTNMRSVSESYETGMSSRELSRFRDTLQALKWEEMNYLTLPGRWITANNTRYWSTEHKLVELAVQQILEGLPPYNREELVVDVYNGNGINGFAARTASRLRDQDFQIGRVDNATEVETTHIYYLEEYKLAALEIAMLLDVEAVLIEEPYDDSNNPVAVILGRDLLGGNE